MKILFIHQNFPAQFKSLAPALVNEGYQISCFTINKAIKKIEGVNYFIGEINRASSPNIHPWLADLETKTIRGEAFLRLAYNLFQQGYYPDLIIAHPGWGESLFLKEVWPLSKLAIYCEFFYNSKGYDVGFDPEFRNKIIGALPSEMESQQIFSDLIDSCRLQYKNINNNLHISKADFALSPTKWQASSFPKDFQKKITIIHDGIDTQTLIPNPSIEFIFNSRLKLTKNSEVVTFVNRDLEPYRGYHSFMRSLPKLLKKRPNLIVLIIGGDSTSYGTKPPEGKTWKDIFANEVKSKIDKEDLDRILFLGTIPYDKYIGILQLSTVHVYLTYPFILSWSLLEAMSIGCSIIASDTKPVSEVIINNRNGILVDFFDYDHIASEISGLLDNKNKRDQLSKRAREYAIKNYDLKTICLPRQIKWVKNILNTK